MCPELGCGLTCAPGSHFCREHVAEFGIYEESN